MSARADVLQRANARGFVIETDAGAFPGTLTGYALDYPRAVALRGAVSVEISWQLAERLAAGESSRVIA